MRQLRPNDKTRFKINQRMIASMMALLLSVALCSIIAGSQQTEPSLPLSQRLTINLASGMPEYVADASSASNAPQSNWWFENTNSQSQYSTQNFTESTDSSAQWAQVGLPYDANIARTFINQTSGGGQGSLDGNENWYRLHFKVDPKYATQKFILELEGSHTGVQVYINGTFLPGVSAVAADAKATHVVGFVPVAVDLTPYLKADGSTDNVIAIDVSRGSAWFEQPNFSGAFRFGQAMTGLFRNVKLFVTNPVHIPINVYSNQKTWGTYVGTKSITPAAQGTATGASAVVEVQTNVLNESGTTQQVTLTTQIVDANGDVVVTAPPITQSVAPMTSANFPSTERPMFQQDIAVPNPTLWYPNNSIYGKPYMYKVYHIVSVDGAVVDSAQSPLGIRVITWDNNFPYFNGHAMYLWGASGRYDYPALGSAVPDEQVWRDLAQFAASGGNVWRPGHSTSSEEFVEAADAYGIMIDQPSGDGEGSFTSPSADDTILKTELHRDMIIRDRSHPSILDWEEDNGGNNISLVTTLASLEAQWDDINPREQATRAYLPAYANYVGLDECDGAGCEVGIKQSNPTKPAFGAEYWDNIGTGRGLAWDNELAFAAPYLNDWRNGRANNTFGMAQWYFADTPGEVSLYSEYQSNPNMSNYVRSLGYSMVDMNRFPRLLYFIYEANWTPYSIKPMVALAHHWNRAYEYTTGTPIQENAFSNCPSVRLLINGVNKDPLTGATLADQTPNLWNIQSGGDLTQNTTVMPGQVHWMVNWAPGTVTAECIDENGNVVPSITDSRTTAGAKNKIVLTVVPELQKPDGTSFQWTSNGSDAAFVVAQVQDSQGNLVPTAADNVTFSVTGPAAYMGGSQQLVADPAVTTYYQDAFSKANSNVINGLPYAFFHSPGDPELNFEGGLTKIALRSTFTPGTVTVTASAPGLLSGSVELSSVAPPTPVQSQSPAIIVPPVSESVTAGNEATFTVAASGSGALKYQWYLGNTAIAGATGTSYTTPATTLANNNETFMVTVTSASGFGAVTSNPVTLSVVAPANATITAQPASQTTVVGQAATFSVGASGSPQLNYAWYEDNALVANGAQSAFTTPILTAAGTHTFYVIVSNPLNQVQSANAVLTVNAATPVSFVTQPASQIAAANQPVQLTATVAGSRPYTYQWQFTPKGGSATILASDTQISNTITYVIPAMSATDVGAYTVTINNAASVPVTSAVAQITLAPPGNNLALGRPATSSSTQNACADGATAPPFAGAGCLGAENAVDGNLNSRWGSATAGAPPTPLVPGVDPSWLQVDLGSTQAFNTVVITWEAAYAAQYLIQYTNADPATNPVWSVADTNNSGVGGTETLTFPTVRARYVRIYGTLRSTNYGYSIYELQIYNIPQLGGPTQRYSTSPSNPAFVVDNLLGLTWTSTIKTNTAVGSQFTGVDAAAYCSSIGMRLPTQAEALDISGINNASKAFPGPWNTWTSTLDPNDANQTAIVGFDGSVEEKVTNNWPGETLCTTGTSSAQAAVIQAQPQAATALVGQSAMFTVTASGKPSPSYQWLENNTVIPGATSATYITLPIASTDNGASFSVIVSNGENTVTSSSAVLTVGTTSGGGGGGAAAPVITTQPASQTVAPGATATFSVAATGSGTLTYQWFKNSATIAGATSESYTTPATAAADNGSQFSVVVTSNGTSVTSNPAVLTVSSAGSSDVIAIDAGSPTGTGSFVGDTRCTAGDEYDPGHTITIPAAIAAISAPEGVYESACQGGQTFILGGLVSGNSYTVVLHFAELYFTAAGKRQFNVAINGTPVAGLQNFDIFAAAGNASLTAVVKTIPNVTAVNGQIVIAFTNGAFDQPMFNGIEIQNTSTATTAATPAAISIDAGSPVAVGNFAADTACAIGAEYDPGQTITIPSSISAIAAPEKVYESACQGTRSYAIPGLVSGNSYTVVLHFAELYFTAAGKRQFNVSINGTPVTGLQNFDIFAAAGNARFTAVVKSIPSMIAANGQIVIAFSNGALDQPMVNGIEVQGVMAAPAITAQPQNTTVNQGSTATFSVTAGGTGPLTYQWSKGGIAISGANSASYTTPPTVDSDNGSTFQVAVTSGGQTTPSSIATLTVTAPTGTAPTITTQPANQNATVGSTATFTVAAGGTGPFIYQWLKNGVAILGATSASYTTPTLAATDKGGLYSVTIGNAAGTGTVTSMVATLSVGNYTIYPGFVGVDLNNNTNGVWANSQIYVTVIGIDPATGRFAYLTPGGTIVDFTLNDSSAPGHLTQNGQNFGNYSFTLAQSTLLKIPTFISARAYISLGAPLYVQVNGDGNGNVTGYAGPNPQNATDPNVNTHFDWYEFNNQNGIFINSTQVDEFGLPLLLDVWGSGGTFHKQVGITESIAQIDSEFATQVPAQFQPPAMSNLRIFSPAKLSMAAGAANGNYFDSYVAGAWASYATTPLSITLNGRKFTGTASGTTLTFNEVNPAAANVGESFVVQQPSTQDILVCAGAMATGVSGNSSQLQDENAVQLQLENQICSATNRGVLLTPANWANAGAYYGASPANFYSQFWHNHSIGGLAYGFSYDDNNNQSTTITTQQPEHMAFGIGW
jgi:beta-galactosidase